jgi:hypothetical protein
MSMYLKRLDEQIAASTDEIYRAERFAEGAMYSARAGDFAFAKKVVEELRAKFGSAVPRLAIWVMLLEGVTLFFESLREEAFDRIRRAHILSQRAGDQDLVGLCASWLAHIEFNRSRFEEMGSLLLPVCSSVAVARRDTRARAYSTLAGAAMYAGLMKVGREYFELARNEGVALGDETVLSGIIYNRGWLTLAYLRASYAIGHCDEGADRFLEMEIASSRNFEMAAGHTALPQMLDVARGRLLLYRERYAEAAAVLGEQLRGAKPIGIVPGEALLKLEYALCLAMSGGMESARTLFDSAAEIPSRSLTCDERVIFYSLYRRLAQALGSTVPRAMIDRFEACRAEYLKETEQLRGWIVRLTSELSWHQPFRETLQ